MLLGVAAGKGRLAATWRPVQQDHPRHGAA
jgi:hypothetical protein